MAASLLMCWVGATDLLAVGGDENVGLGPIAQALQEREFAEVHLLNNYPESRVAPFVKWLRKRTDAAVSLRQVKLSSPTAFGEIYPAAVQAVEEALARQGAPASLTFHLSPGTPAMAAIWIILAKTRFPAELIESSREHGVRVASVPFDISADFIPDLLRGSDQRLERLSAALPPHAPEFANIVHRSPAMKRVVAMARLVALRSVPVLIEGESGTGKELLARAIHGSSPRRDRAFVAVNCGAIPADLLEAQLFGHEKGAFTGASEARTGFFEAAQGGTLFLDEIGELSLAAQVKLLRALQEGEIIRLGATRPTKLDLRIVAATNRRLAEEVQHGRFREDLYYRLAVAVLRLPPLSARPGDVGLLVDHLLATINDEMSGEPGFRAKRLAPGGRNLLLAHRWPGNVRELHSTLRRAAIWTTGDTIRTDDVRESLLDGTAVTRADLLGRPLGPDLSLPSLMAQVARHYLQRALHESRGNKSEAARLVGLPSYQTFSNWMERYGVDKAGKRGADE